MYQLFIWLVTLHVTSALLNDQFYWHDHHFIDASEHVVQKREISHLDLDLKTTSDIDENLSVNSNLSSVYYLNDTHENLVIKWVGGGSSVLVCLAKYRASRYINKSMEELRNLTSNLYISYDYGATFDKIDHLRLLDGGGGEPVLSNFYISQFLNTHFIFTDVLHKHLFISHDHGRSFSTVKTQFSPKQLHLHPTMPQFVLGADENNSTDENLYFSNDFGVHWDIIATNVKRFSWGNAQYDPKNRIFIQQRTKFGFYNLLSSDDFFQKSKKEWLTNVHEFRLSNNYLLIQRNLSLLGSPTRDRYFELWVSYNRSNPEKAFFDHTHKKGVKVTEYFLADASENEIFLAVRFNDSTTDLYISNLKGNKFKLSLKNLIAGSLSSSNGAKINTVDIHRVAGLEGIYIANVINNDKKGDPSVYESMITFDKGALWNPVKAPQNIDLCKGDCRLYLLQNNPFKYQSIMSRDSAVGLILATGNISKDDPVPKLFLSRDGGAEWREVFDGRYIFNIGDYGGIIVAIKNYNKLNVTDRLVYSLDEGETWQNLRFINQSIKVYSLLTENGEKTSTFTIFGSLNADKHSWVLVKVNLTYLVSNICDPATDYEMWTPHPPNRFNSKCLMGRYYLYQRRKAHTHCLNGENWEKVKISHNCDCVRDDYDCDYNYELNQNTSECLPQNDNVNLVNEMCKPGETSIQVSRGYRKVVGNTCLQKENDSFSPILQVCPQEPEHQKGKSVLKTMIESFLCTIALFSSIFGALYFFRTKQTRTGNLFTLTNTHYSTRSDSAILLDADELDNDDGPIIRGFSDEVPMVVT